MNESEICKLRAIGYRVEPNKNWHAQFAFLGTLEVGHGDHEDSCYEKRLGAANFGDRICAGTCDTDAAWSMAKAHAQSADGLKTTMADKVRWLKMRGPDVAISFEPDGQKFYAYRGKTFTEPSYDSPEAAVDALFWAVP